ncbi:unnamed protein product, partial [Discosporangium mesarthrocarpum]
MRIKDAQCFKGKQRPYIALAGDCSQAAYILRPVESPRRDEGGRLTALGKKAKSIDRSIEYEMVCAIELQGTVGSLAVSYGDVPGESATVWPRVGAAMRLGEFPSQPGGCDNAALGQGATAHGRGKDMDAETRGNGWAKLFIPNYDGDRIYVFAIGPEEPRA